MIQKLRLKFTLLVLLGLLVISTGVVFSINFVNHTAQRQQAEAALRVLLQSDGRRPVAAIAAGEIAPPEGVGPIPSTRIKEPGQPRNDQSFMANLSTFYTVRLDGDGVVTEWYSERPELYNDAQVTELAAAVLAEGKTSGKIGTQYYMTDQRPYGTILVVLDKRMESESARKLLINSSLVGLASYLIMSAGAVWIIRRMTRPVQEAFDRQKQFVWDASHELKTPLAVISANAEALAGEVGESRWLTYIQSEVQRTDLLVKSLLTLARMDRADGQLQSRAFDLSRAILSVALPFESVAFETGKSLELDVAPNISCTGDEEQIKQMTVILLDNAIKYADPGGTISVSLRTKGDRQILQVHNTGRGIAKEDLPHVFERFYRADQSHSREISGAGLGLAIAKAIVAAHRGKITVESEPGQWARFTVTL